jgi:serine/threonine-protein kinase
VTPDLLERLNTVLTGRYRVERELGQGGMALVFLARDLRHDRNVALKVLRPELASEVGPDRFLREIKFAARLTHPHILPLFDSGEAAGSLFYVMPYVAGESLRERLNRERQLPLEIAIDISRQVAAALDFAHSHGVVHRDIKPENILLHDRVAMVADFGIGKALSAAADTGTITRTGTAVGTPTYMSPEQATGQDEIDGRSDIFSLACVVYEMLGGEPPFTGPTPQAVIARRLMDTPPHVRALRNVPDPMDLAICKGLAREPIDRFPTAGAFIDVLVNAALPAQHASPVPATAAAPEVSLQSIAVFPFVNLSADPENEYFSDGMTEEIINAIGKVEGLQVASRTSSFALKGKKVDIGEIGRTLKVGTVLEGSVRKAGNRIRIAAQLIKVSDGYNLWSETFDRELEDVFAIQDEISHAIVDVLKVRLTSGQPTDHRSPIVVPATENLEAYTLYLKGRFFYNRFTESDLKRSLDLYRQALAEDPSYARAYAGIADSWADMADDWLPPDDAYPRAKEAAAKALELDASLPEAFTSMGKVLGWYEWDFAGAVAVLERATKLNPNYAEARFVLGSVLPCLGRLDDAIAEIRRALELDPLSANVGYWLARFLLYRGDYVEAIEQSSRMLDIHVHFYRAYLNMGHAYLELGDVASALEQYRRAQALEGSVPSYDAFVARGLALSGEVDKARRILTGLVERAQERYIRPEVLAVGFAALGDTDEAFAQLELALTARSAGLVYLGVDPMYRPLRDDPRFARLMSEVGLDR